MVYVISSNGQPSPANYTNGPPTIPMRNYRLLKFSQTLYKILLSCKNCANIVEEFSQKKRGNVRKHLLL